MKDTVIRVTREDIANGKRNRCQHCPVALAILRRITTRYEVSVGNFFTSIEDCWTQRHVSSYELPPHIRDFIITFDFHGPDAVKPTKFIMPIPEEALVKPENKI